LALLQPLAGKKFLFLLSKIITFMASKQVALSLIMQHTCFFYCQKFAKSCIKHAVKWFTRPRFILFLYYIPALSVFALCMYSFFHAQKKAKPANSRINTPVCSSQAPVNRYSASVMYSILFKIPYYMPVNTQTTHRLVIYAADIRQLTGCSKSSSHRQLEKIKEQLGRQPHQYVMIEEYCTAMGLSYDKTLVQLKLK
jgi:hypothetical protein